MLRSRSIRTGIFAALSVCLLLLVLASPAQAQRRRGEMRAPHRTARVVAAPRDLNRIVVGKREFFYSRGVFYRGGPRGYVVIGAPVGARIRVLPEGYTSVMIGGGQFFLYYGTYYRFDPADKMYVVVNPAPNSAQSPPAVTDRVLFLDGTTLDGTFVGGDNNTVRFQANGSVQEIPIDQIVSITFAPPPPE